MYDKVTLWINLACYNNTNQRVIKEQLNEIDWNDVPDFKNGRPIYVGKIQNLSVRLFENGIMVMGSLCKLLLKNNFDTLSRGEIQRVILLLSKYLKCSASDIKVTSVEFGTVVTVGLKPRLYFLSIASDRNGTKVKKMDGVYFHQTHKSIVFYDKGKESKRKGNRPPENYLEKNTIRYELTLKNLRHYFHGKEVTLADLGLPTTFKKFWRIWIISLLRIYPQNVRGKLTIFDSVKQLRTQLIGLGIMAAGGPDKVLDVVNFASITHSFSTHEKHYCKQFVKKHILQWEKTQPFDIQRCLLQEMKRLFLLKGGSFLKQF